MYKDILFFSSKLTVLYIKKKNYIINILPILCLTMFVILRTGAVVELRQFQDWRTCKHISYHQPLGTWVWWSKMSRTSLVWAEWPVEFKRDFDIITRELSRAALLFHWWSSNLREPSNWSIKSLYKETR